MRKASVVIGSNYGDCGKGLITDYLSNEDTIVIRHNVFDEIGAKSILLSRGRTRNDISLHKPRSFDTLSL